MLFTDHLHIFTSINIFIESNMTSCFTAFQNVTICGTIKSYVSKFNVFQYLVLQRDRKRRVPIHCLRTADTHHDPGLARG